MKTRRFSSLITLLILLASSVAVIAQPQAPDVLWTRTFDGGTVDMGYSVIQTFDGGFAIGGTTRPSTVYNDFWLIKTNSLGIEEFNHSYGGNNEQECHCLIQDSDSGFVMLGKTNSLGAGSDDIWLVKTNSNGDEIWNRTFGGVNGEDGQFVQKTNDNGFIITGNTDSYGNGGGDVYLIKTDSNGNLQWTRTFGGNLLDCGYCVRSTLDGGYIIVGCIGTTNFGPQVYLIKTDSNGILTWERQFGGVISDFGYSVQQTADGGYIVCGKSNSFGSGDSDIYLIRTDESGDTLWTQTYGGTAVDCGESVIENSQGYFILTGWLGQNSNDLIAMKVDANGDSIWTIISGEVYPDEGREIALTDDGGYIIAGNTQSFGVSSKDAFLIRLDSDIVQTNLLSGPLSGSVGPGTYNVVGDISIEQGQSLNIAPGTTFLFNGNYQFNINGYLYAVGTEDDSIKFLPQTGIPFWNGIHFYDTAPDSNQVGYWRVSGSHLHGILCSSTNPGISNCLIDNNWAPSAAGIHCYSASPTISDCIITNNAAQDDAGGIGCHMGANPNVSNCIISNNTSNHCGAGINLIEGTANNPTFDHCVIADNHLNGLNGGGIHIAPGSRADLINCVFSGNSALNNGSAIHIGWNSSTEVINSIITGNTGTQAVNVEGGFSGQIIYSDFYNNPAGNFWGSPPGGLGTITTVNANNDPCDQYFNIFLDPLFSTNPDSLYRLTENSPCIDAGDPASPPDPDSTIADMGAYYFWHEEEQNLSGPLSGILEADEYHVVGDISVEQGQSLTIEPGTTLLFDENYHFNIYGYIFANGSEIDSVKFMPNPGNSYWGGLEFFDSASDNSALEYCLFTGGRADGTYNVGGALYIANCSPRISHSTITGNTAQGSGGGLGLSISGAIIEYCVITDNICENYYGGGIWMTSSWPIIDHCVIEGNSSANLCGGIHIEQSNSAQIKNSIIADNQSSGVNLVNSPGYISYCDLYNNSGGAFTGSTGGVYGVLSTVNSNGDSCDIFNNIFLNPLFSTNPDSLYRLTAASPCIDAGDPGSPPDPDSTMADMGAYYYDQAGIPPSLTLTSPNGGEYYTIGQTMNIQWSNDPGFASFDLSLSRNNGIVWESIANGLTGNFFAWNVTAPESDSCLVRILGHCGALEIWDVSNGVFSVANAMLAPDTLWTRTFGESGDEVGFCVQQTSDGGFVLTGSQTSPDTFSNVYLLKTDFAGNQSWVKTFGGTAGDAGSSVQQTSDGGYIITGYTNSLAVGYLDVYLIKTDAAGNQSWYRTYGGNNDDRGNCVQQTSDGGYIVAGVFNYTGQYTGDVYLIKTDADGDTLWTKTFGGTGGEWAYSVQQTTDGGYIIAGYTTSYGAGSDDFYLIKTDALGNQLWYKTFGGIDSDIGQFAEQTTDGGYILTGWTQSFGAGLYDVYLIKTDALGNQLWHKTFGGIDYDEGLSVQKTYEGYVIAGWTQSLGAGLPDVYIIKTDTLGNQIWYKTVGGINNDQGRSIQLTSDGSYIIAGKTCSYGAGGEDAYLIRLEGDGTIPPLVSLTSPIGGESLTIGESAIIFWSFTGEIDSFAVQLSRNGGALFEETLAEGIPGDTTQWTWNEITPPTSDSCVIRIIGYFGQFQTADQSDSLFSIVNPPPPPVITVIYPDGNEIFTIGDTDTLRWNCSTVFDSLNLHLSRSDTANWTPLAQGLAGNLVEWIWPGVTGPASDNCRIKIEGYLSGFVYSDISDSLFSIVNPQLPPDTLWTHTYGGAANEEGWSHCQIPATGGFIVTGAAASGASDNVYFIKTDANGGFAGESNIGGINNDGGYCIKKTNDNNYIVAGYTYSYGAGSADYYLIKIGENLQSLWTTPHTFGGSLEDRAYSVVEVPGGGFAMTGFRTTSTTGKDIYMVRTDAAGVYTWHQTIGAAGIDEARCIENAAGGGFIIAGWTENFTADSIDALVLRTNAAGEESLSVVIGGAGVEKAYDIIQLEDGSFVGVGSTTSTPNGNEDVLLFKVSGGVTLQWTQTYGGVGNDAGYSVKKTPDGGFIISGKTDSWGSGDTDLYIIRTDASGIQTEEIVLGGPEDEAGRCVTLVSNIGYAVSGFTESYGTGGKDVWLVRLGAGIPPVLITLTPQNPPIIIPANGGSFNYTIAVDNTTLVPQTTDVWSQIILPSGAAVPIFTVYDITFGTFTVERLKTQNVPGFAPGGIYTYYAYTGDYPWVIEHSDHFNFQKLGPADGSIGESYDWLCSGQLFDGENSVFASIPQEYCLNRPYPNPFNPTATITYGLPVTANVEIIVYNIRGQEVAQLVDEQQYPGLHSVTFDAGNYPSGIYFIRMCAGKFSRTEKLILLK